MRTFDAKTMIRVNDVRELAKHVPYQNKPGCRRYWVEDVSGGTADKFELVVQEYQPCKLDNGEVIDWFWKNIKTIAITHDTSIPDVKNKIGDMGAYGPTFDRADISMLTIPLRAARELVGLTMRKASTLSDTPYRTWQNWETEGHRNARRTPGIVFSWLELYRQAQVRREP